MIKFRDHQTARFWSRRLESVWRPNTWARSQNFGLDCDPKAKISVSVLISRGYGLGLGLDLKNSLSFLKASFNITGRRHDEGRDVGHRDGHLRPDGQVHDSGVSMTKYQDHDEERRTTTLVVDGQVRGAVHRRTHRPRTRRTRFRGQRRIRCEKPIWRCKK